MSNDLKEEKFMELLEKITNNDVAINDELTAKLRIGNQKLIKFLKENKDNINPIILNCPELTMKLLSAFSIYDSEYELIDNGGILVLAKEEFNKDIKQITKFKISCPDNKFIRSDQATISTKENPQDKRFCEDKAFWQTILYNQVGIELTQATAVKDLKPQRYFISTEVNDLKQQLIGFSPEFNNRFGYYNSSRSQSKYILNKYRNEKTLGSYTFYLATNKGPGLGYDISGGICEADTAFPTHIPNSLMLSEYTKIGNMMDNMNLTERQEYNNYLKSDEYNIDFLRKAVENNNISPEQLDFFNSILLDKTSNKKL